MSRSLPFQDPFPAPQGSLLRLEPLGVAGDISKALVHRVRRSCTVLVPRIRSNVMKSKSRPSARSRPGCGKAPVQRRIPSCAVWAWPYTGQPVPHRREDRNTCGVRATTSSTIAALEMGRTIALRADAPDGADGHACRRSRRGRRSCSAASAPRRRWRSRRMSPRRRSIDLEFLQARAVLADTCTA
jgi:hypothetical protein